MFRGVDSVWTLVLNTGSMGKGPAMQKVFCAPSLSALDRALIEAFIEP
jgi:hypothetical protein